MRNPRVYQIDLIIWNFSAISVSVQIQAPFLVDFRYFNLFFIYYLSSPRNGLHKKHLSGMIMLFLIDLKLFDLKKNQTKLETSPRWYFHQNRKKNQIKTWKFHVTEKAIMNLNLITKHFNCKIINDWYLDSNESLAKAQTQIRAQRD